MRGKVTMVMEKNKKVGHARKEKHGRVKHQEQGRDLGGQ